MKCLDCYGTGKVRFWENPETFGDDVCEECGGTGEAMPDDWKTAIVELVHEEAGE